MIPLLSTQFKKELAEGLKGKDSAFLNLSVYTSLSCCLQTRAKCLKIPVKFHAAVSFLLSVAMNEEMFF